MDISTVKAARESGFKVKALAKHIDVHESTLSMALRGERSLPEGKEKQLKIFLSKIPR